MNRKKILIIFSIVFLSNLVSAQLDYRLFFRQAGPQVLVDVKPLIPTDQTYNVFSNDSVFVAWNPALRLVEIKGLTALYFDGKFVGTYATEIVKNSDHFILRFKVTNSYYFFYKIYMRPKETQIIKEDGH